MARKRWGWGTFVGIGIALLWLGVMGHLVKNHLMRPGPSGASIGDTEAELELTRNWRDVEEYMLLRMGERTIGAFSTVVRRADEVAGSSYVANFRLGARLRMGPLSRPVEFKGVGHLDSKLNLNRFHLEGNLAGLPLRLTGLIGGNVLMLRNDARGEPQLVRINLGREVSLLEAVRPTALREFQIKPGNSMRIPVVDPLFSMQRGVAELLIRDLETITVAGREREAYRVEMRLNDFVSTSWVDRRGKTLKRQVIGKLTMEVTTAEEAQNQSPVISETLEIPEIAAAEFRNVPLEEVGTALGPESSLLSMLSGSAQ